MPVRLSTNIELWVKLRFPEKFVKFHQFTEGVALLYPEPLRLQWRAPAAARKHMVR